MRAPAFWWKPTPDALALALSPFGALYGAIAARRMGQPGVRVDSPVVCVGNFVTGGAGKTPTAIALARALAATGRTPHFLSRGYGASADVTTPVLVNAKHSAKDVGDEPLLLARVGPAIVCADRVAGARAAIANGANVIVMDDGLQNPSLTKHFRIAVVDGAMGIGNGLCVPAGPLRAPLDAQWALTDALVVIGPGEAGELMAAAARDRGIPVVRARLAPDEAAAARLRGRRVLAFAGIGRPQKFFETLRSLGADVAGSRPFADHRPYTAQDLAQLRSEAKRLGAILVTTEKDAVRIGAEADIAALPVSLVPDDAGAFAALAAAAVGQTGPRV